MEKLHAIKHHRS